MTKKSFEKKRQLGRAAKRSGRMPLLARVRSHRRIQMNKFARNWRKQKLDIKTDK